MAVRCKNGYNKFMTLQDFAALYVNHLESFAKIAFFVIIAIVVMCGLNRPEVL